MNGVTFHANVPSRAKVMIDLEKRCKTMAMKPKSLPRELGGDVTESLPVFNFKAMLASLLHDGRLMQPGNVVVKPDDPVHFQERHSLETLDVDELHTGTVCRNSVKETCIGPQDVFVGMILCIDGTVLGNFTNAKLEPVVFSLSVFNRETRNQSCAWRPLGHIKRPVDNLINEEQGLDSLKGRNNRNCHSALRLTLKDLIAVQKDGGCKCDLIIGNNINHGMQLELNLELKLVCVIGDCEGADSLCSRHASHSLGVKSSCHDCKCLTVDADRTDLECEWRQQIDFFNAADAELKQMSHCKVANVFDDIDMCDNTGGISLCTPPEILHWKNLGLDKLAVLHFNEQVSGNGQNAKTFNALLGAVSQFCQHQSDRNMPLVTFNKGFASLTKKSTKAAEHAGLMLAHVIACWQTHAGKACFQRRAGLDKHDETTDFIRQFEQLLACEAWMKCGEKNMNTLPACRQTFVAVMQNHKKTVNRTEALGLQTTKFHQTRHIVDCISQLGSPENINSARNENHHINNTKKPARTAQIW